MSIDAPPPVQAPVQEALFQSYDVQRRLRATRNIARFLLAAATIGFVFEIFAIAYVSFTTQSGSKPLLANNQFLMIFGAIVFVSLMYGMALLAVRREQDTFASVLTVSTTILTIFGIQFVWFSAHGVTDPEGWALFMAFLVPIGVAGATAPRWLLFVTVVLVNIYTAGILTYLNLTGHADTLLQQDFLNVIGGSILIEWTVTLLLIGIQDGYRRIVRDISQLRYEVEQAKKLDDLKDQFIANINHELRNPIMALLGYLQTLHLTVERMAREDVVLFIDQAYDVSQNVRGLVESILDARRLDQNAADYVPESVNVIEALNQAMKLLNPREVKGTQRDLHIKVPAEMAIWGEKVRLQQILSNLLSNAIKYSPADTPIEFAANIVSITPDKGQTALQAVEITVRDHGHGIPPDHASLLFQRFVRLPRDLSSNIVGNGLGLYLCRVLSEAMGGRIWVESTGMEGEGSTFYLQLPLPPATGEENGAGPSSSTATGAERATVGALLD